MNLDEAISCAAQNLDAPANAQAPIQGAKPSPSIERQKSEFWNEMDSVAF